jgi:hypothetical protein
MLNLLNVKTPIIVNDVTYPNSQAAYEALKTFEGKITVKIPNGHVGQAAPAKPKKSLFETYKEMTGEDIVAPEIQEQLEELDSREYRIKVKKWMTEKSSPGFDFMQKWNNDIPMPLVIMRGTVLEETKGMLKMELRATPEPSSHCFVCGRALSHPVSVLYGIGPECGGHFHINPLGSKAALDAAMEEIKSKMESITWTGWVIKSSIKEMKEINRADIGYQEGA